MESYRFGIIGCGMISEFHAAGMAEVPNAKLTAVASRHEDNRRKLTDQYGCEGHEDYREMVRRDDVDIVCICTPSGAHLEPALAAAEAGKHVICEKPLEVTLERCDEMIRACEENSVRLCGIFPYRFTPGARTLREAVDAGRFGRLTVGDACNKWFRDQAYYDSGEWRGTWKLDGGGACMNQGIHAVDLVQWYMGDVETVYGSADCLAHERIEVEDTAVAAIRYKSGAMGVIECATSCFPGLPRQIELHGDKGTVVMAQEHFARWEFAEERPEDEEIRRTLSVPTDTGSGAANARDISHENFREEFKDVLHALDTDSPLPIEGREARKSVEIILALYRSAKRGEPVTLPL